MTISHLDYLTAEAWQLLNADVDIEQHTKLCGMCHFGDCPTMIELRYRQTVAAHRLHLINQGAIQ